MKYICDLINNNELKKKNDINVSKLEINIADDINTEVGPEPVFKYEIISSILNIFSLILEGLSIFVLIISASAMLLDLKNKSLTILSKAIVVSLILLLINVVIKHITSKKLTTIDIQKNNYNANKRRVLSINKLLEFLSNKDNYSNISYDPKTRIITYFNEDGLLRDFNAIDEINENSNAYTEYWMNNYIKIDIDNDKITKYYPVKYKKVQ